MGGWVGGWVRVSGYSGAVCPPQDGGDGNDADRDHSAQAGPADEGRGAVLSRWPSLLRARLVSGLYSVTHIALVLV